MFNQQVYNKTYYLTHADQCRETARKYYHQHKKEKKVYRRKYYKAHKAAIKDYILRHFYNITLQQYKNLVTKQEGKCLICKQVKKLYVDHAHSTKHIRGLLCNECNKGIGLFKDNSSWLLTASLYLSSGVYT